MREMTSQSFREFAKLAKRKVLVLPGMILVGAKPVAGGGKKSIDIFIFGEVQKVRSLGAQKAPQSVNYSLSTVTTSPSITLVVNGTALTPFLFTVRQNKWYLEVATSRAVVSSPIFTIDSTLSGPMSVMVSTLAP